MNENIIQIGQTQDLPLNINGEKILLDRDVAYLYEVETKRVNEAVKKNQKRFPDGCIIELTKEQKNELVEKFDRFKILKHSTVNPKAFTEKGIYMLATILTNDKGINTTIKDYGNIFKNQTTLKKYKLYHENRQ